MATNSGHAQFDIEQCMLPHLAAAADIISNAHLFPIATCAPNRLFSTVTISLLRMSKFFRYIFIRIMILQIGSTILILGGWPLL
jgi:hypothetical protein